MSHLLALTLVLAGLPAAFQEGSQVPAPPAVEPPTPIVIQGPLDTLFEGALVGAVDGEGFSETPGYRKLVESVSHHSEAELIEKARTELDHTASLAAPDKWRGAIVHVRGLVAGIDAVKLSSPIGEEGDVYRAIITEADGTEGVVVDFAQHPPVVELQYDVVDVEGVFFRTVQYENRKGEIVTAPYLIARNLRVLDLEKAPGRTVMDPLGKILIGAAILFVVVRVLMSVQRSRSRGAVRLRQPPPPPTRPS